MKSVNWFKAVLCVVLAGSPLVGQEKTQAPGEAARDNRSQAVIIPVKTLTGDSFNRLVKLLGVFSARLQADDRLRVIVVYGPKDIVEQMRKVVEELDRPGSEAAVGRNIDLTLSFLRCSTKPPTENRPLPADLEPVAKQLRAATSYRDIQLWESLPLRLQEGRDAEQSHRMPFKIEGLEGGTPAATAQIRLLPDTVIQKDSGRHVRFARMNIGLRIPYVIGNFRPAQGGASPMVNTQFQFADVGFNTSGDFKEGQKTVVGKMSGLEDDNAIFVVISLKILD